MASYTYDAYGNISAHPINDDNLSVIGSALMMILLPQSYRGYTFSFIGEELSYYLGSRFYSPRLGRFLNADDPSYLGIGDSLVNCNIFAYCNNNPVNDTDPNGHISLNSVKNFFANIISTLKNNINNYLQSQFSIKNGVLSISTNTITIVINTIIASFCAGKIVNASSSVLSYVLNRYKEKAPQKVVDIFTYIINGLNNKGVIKTIAKIIAKKLVVRNTVVKESMVTAIAKDLLSGILIGNNQLLKKVNTICSAVSSIGGFLAFIISGLDKNWFDGYLRINIFTFKRRYL